FWTLIMVLATPCFLEIRHVNVALRIGQGLLWRAVLGAQRKDNPDTLDIESAAAGQSALRQDEPRDRFFRDIERKALRILHENLRSFRLMLGIENPVMSLAHRADELDQLLPMRLGPSAAGEQACPLIMVQDIEARREALQSAGDGLVSEIGDQQRARR